MRICQSKVTCLLVDCCFNDLPDQWVRSLDLTAHTNLSPIRRGFVPSFVNYKKGCTRLTVASDKVYQLLAQGWWFSPGTPASSTTKTSRHDIAESGVKHQNQINALAPFKYALYTSLVKIRHHHNMMEK
jgi:hypothetical protein